MYSNGSGTSSIKKRASVSPAEAAAGYHTHHHSGKLNGMAPKRELSPSKQRFQAQAQAQAQAQQQVLRSGMNAAVKPTGMFVTPAIIQPSSARENRLLFEDEYSREVQEYMHEIEVSLSFESLWTVHRVDHPFFCSFRSKRWPRQSLLTCSPSFNGTCDPTWSISWWRFINNSDSDPRSCILPSILLTDTCQNAWFTRSTTNWSDAPRFGLLPSLRMQRIAFLPSRNSLTCAARLMMLPHSCKVSTCSP